MRAARRAAGSLEPPRVMGGPPGVAGVGVTRTVRPRYSKGSPVQACLSTVTASVVRLGRSFMGAPNISNSELT